MLGGATVLDIGIQACAGLAHLHEAELDGVPLGLIHRDVKPGNLLVDPGGVVKVADFGISRPAGDRHTSGTAGFAPPEQYRGEADRRSDLFALGATLASLVLREPPFGRIRSGDPGPLAAALADRDRWARVEAGLAGGAEVLSRALAPRPEDRFPSAAAFQQALAALRSRQPPSVPLRELAAAVPRPARTGAGPGGRLEVPEAELTSLIEGNHAPQTDVFVPRPEQDAVERALAEGHRWVTLTGPGGMGKSRLAAEVARTTGGGRSWWFDLGEASTVPAIVGVLARGLQMELPADVPLERVAHALRALGPAVAVLDAADRALPRLAEVVPSLLGAAPDLAVLVTARAPTKAAGEHRVPIGPLGGPAAEALFLARAPRGIEGEERGQVAALVAAVDGMPLAIELLAARAARATVPALLRDLSRHLAAEAPTEPPLRSRSVEAALSGTIDALPGWARAALVDLSVFEGSFTARVTAAVLDAGPVEGPGPLDALEHLTDLGLVRYDAGRKRFALSPMVRDAVRARTEPGDRRRAERRHGRAYAVLGDRDVLALLRGPQGSRRFARLCDDLDQLRAAAERALDRQDVGQVVPLLRALGVVFARRGSAALLLPMLERATALRGLDPTARDELALARAHTFLLLGQLAPARRTAEDALRALRERPEDLARHRLEAEGLRVLAEVLAASTEQALGELAARAAVELADRVGDVLLRADAALVLGSLLGDTAHGEESKIWLGRALRDFHLLGSTRDEAWARRELGMADHLRGRFAEAESWFEAALADARAAHDAVCEMRCLSNLGLVAKDLHRSAEAVARYGEALALARAIGDRAEELWVSGALGFLHLEQLDPREARAPLQRAVQLADSLGDPTLCQWEAALGRWSALEGRHPEAAAWIDSARGRPPARSSHLRVWVRAAAAEVALRAGRPGEAIAELEALDKWLHGRRVEPGSRAHQEVQRVRRLLGEER